jgi:glycosyltransferase involved in cell wall biosynthesis
MTPDVSVVMPVWQPRPSWLLAAVRAVLAEPGCELELIVVDDGCEPPVEALLPDEADPRLRLLRVEHGGVSRARNAGMASARGRWLRFVDADDVVEPGSTAALLHVAGADEDVVPYGETLICDDGLEPVWTLRSRLEGGAIEDVLLARWHVRLPAVLLSGKTARATGDWHPGLAICEDWDYLLRASEHGRLRPYRGIAVRYRRHPDSATADVAAGLRATEVVVSRYFDRHPDQRGTPLERRASGSLAAIAARVQATHGAPRAALRSIARAARLNPTALWWEGRQGIPAVAAAIRRARRGVGKEIDV